MSEPTSVRLELRGIRKSFPNVVANDGVDLRVGKGSIHAVLGENGAGKSTLMKIVYGVVRADAGTILWDGVPVGIASPADARALGIGMVFQHFSLFPALSVAENIALTLKGRDDLSSIADRAVEVSRHYGIPVDPGRIVHTLSVGERQRVEVVRNLLQEPRLLIMDEPTSVLTPLAARELFRMLRQLATEGRSILYISHKLDEVRELCDTATILREGRVVGHVDPREESTRSLAQRMIGSTPPALRRAPSSRRHRERLEIAWQARTDGEAARFGLSDIRFSVREGEIFGVAGIAGNGQAALLAALSGETRAESPGAVHIDGKPVGRLGARQRRRLGLVHVPEERLGRAAVPGMSLSKNALLTAHHLGLARRGLLRPGAMSAFARRCIETYDVRCNGERADARTLSGGNLQKFVVGRELLQNPSVALVAQPTWGLDVRAASAIRSALLEMRRAGVAVLVVSEDLDELFELSDRIAVITAGRLSPIRRIEETDMEEIGRWMGGALPSPSPSDPPVRGDAASA